MRVNANIRMLGVFSSLLFSGCFAIHPPVHPDLSSRLAQIKTVAISPPYIEEYVEPFRSRDTRLVPRSAIGESNLVTALQETFEQAKRFVVRDMDLATSGDRD